MKNMTYGIFNSKEDADKAIESLRENGYNPEDISIIMQEERTKGMGVKIEKGAVSGVEIGGAIGALGGLLVALGALVVPGGLLIGGPILAAIGIGGATATVIEGGLAGALAGGIVGGLTSLGLPEESAKEIQNKIESGGILVAVPHKRNENEGQSEKVLNDFGATQVGEL